MTEHVICRLLEEVLDLSKVEEELIEIIRDELDYNAIASEIWQTWSDEIHEVAAKVAANEILPF